MTNFMRAAALAVGLGTFGFANAALAQENLDAGKSGAQLYAASCAICHKLPDAVTKAEHVLALESFLREHYTASKESAAMVADYLKGVSKEQVANSGRSPKGSKAQVKHKQDKLKDEKATENKKDDNNKGAAKPDKPEDKAKKSEDKPKTDAVKTDAPKGADKPSAPKTDEGKSKPASATEGAKPAGAN